MAGYMIVLSFIDIDKKIVPDGIILCLIITGLVFGIFGFNPNVNIFEGIIGAICGGFLMLGLNFFSNGKVGEGDIKLITAIGLCTGFREITGIIIYAFIFGGIYAAIMLAIGRHKRKDAIAFVPFIAAAFLFRALMF